MTKSKSYTAPTPVQIGGRVYRPGESFTTDTGPGDEWEEVDNADAAIIDAATIKTPVDPNLDAMSKGALEAYAAERGVNTDGMTKERLLTAIRAADEPNL